MEHINTFEEFLQYRIIDKAIVDPVLFTYTDACGMNAHDYNIIWKVESFCDDFIHIKDCILDVFYDYDFEYELEPLLLPTMNRKYNETLTGYRTIDRVLLEAVIDIYKEDMVMLDYSWKVEQDKTLIVGSDANNDAC